jgi:hypothetical protein
MTRDIMSLDFYPRGHAVETKCLENLRANYPRSGANGDNETRQEQSVSPPSGGWQRGRKNEIATPPERRFAMMVENIQVQPCKFEPAKGISEKGGKTMKNRIQGNLIIFAISANYTRWISRQSLAVRGLAQNSKKWRKIVTDFLRKVALSKIRQALVAKPRRMWACDGQRQKIAGFLKKYLKA